MCPAVARHCSVWLLFVAEYTHTWMAHTLGVLSSVDGHLGGSHFVAFVKNAAGSICVYAFVRHTFSFLLRRSQELTPSLTP